MTNKEDFIYEKESDYNQIQKGEWNEEDNRPNLCADPNAGACWL